MPASRGYGSRVPMRTQQKGGGGGGIVGAGGAGGPIRPGGGGGAIGYGGGRPIPSGSRFGHGWTPPGPPQQNTVPMREPRPNGGGILTRNQPVELDENAPPDFAGPPGGPPGQMKKGGLPFGWHYDISGTPTRNMGRGLPGGGQMFLSPRTASPRRSRNVPMRRGRKAGWTGAFGAR